ncbi:MAG: amidohydrolase [Chloroflexi bacterium]|nr:amidohydrolase [Chloroflexota bacterium]
MPSPRTVDMHAHVLSPKLVELTSRAPSRDANPHNEFLMQSRYKRMFESLDVRIETMDREGIDMQVVSHMPNYAYWADRELSEQIVEAANTAVQHVCQSNPERFVGLAFVSLQFPDLAARQLEGAMSSSGAFKGVEISSNVQGLDLDDERFEPFWAAAEQHGALVFIHPSGTTLGDRVAKYYLANIIGNPLDTTLALTHIIFGGVLERHPRLKILGAHGGGYLPSYCSRSDHGYEVRPEAQTIPSPPSHYVRRLWVDNLMYNAFNLAHLIAQVGASQVVLGTDYPFDMGQENPVEIVDGVAGLSEGDKQQIKRDNAVGLLGLTAAR